MLSFLLVSLSQTALAFDLKSYCQVAEAELKAKAVFCQTNQEFVPGRESLLVVAEDPVKGVSVASFVINGQGDLEVLEIDHSLGNGLMNLQWGERSAKVVLDDINGDGALDWVIATVIPPQTGVLYIKSFDKKLKRVVKLTPHYSRQKEEFSNFTFDSGRRVIINKEVLKLPQERAQVEAFQWRQNRFILVNRGA